MLPLWHQSLPVRVGFAALGLGLISWGVFLFYRKQARQIRRKSEVLELERNKAEAALAGQLQRAMLVQRARSGLHDGDAQSAFADTIEDSRSFLLPDQGFGQVFVFFILTAKFPKRSSLTQTVNTT